MFEFFVETFVLSNRGGFEFLGAVVGRAKSYADAARLLGDGGFVSKAKYESREVFVRLRDSRENRFETPVPGVVKMDIARLHEKGRAFTDSVKVVSVEGHDVQGFDPPAQKTIVDGQDTFEG